MSSTRWLVELWANTGGSSSVPFCFNSIYLSFMLQSRKCPVLLTKCVCITFPITDFMQFNTSLGEIDHSGQWVCIKGVMLPSKASFTLEGSQSMDYSLQRCSGCEERALGGSCGPPSWHLTLSTDNQSLNMLITRTAIFFPEMRQE